MKRRDFLVTASLFATLPAVAMAGDTIVYKTGDVQKALADGKTVLVRYGTPWCGTCASQKRKIGALRSDNPVYDKNIVFVDVDFDQFSNSPISTKRGVNHRSTLVLLKGDKELGRIVSGTSTKQIKAMLDAGVAAASS